MKNSGSYPPLAIIGGTGKEGSGLALRWAAANYPVIIGSRDGQKAQNKATELNQLLGLDNIVGTTNLDAVTQASICVLTVVHTAHLSILTELKDALKGKILVDATARVEFRDPRPPLPPSAGRIAQNLLGAEVNVVAAFQNIPAHILRTNPTLPLGLDILICADDHNASQEIISLIGKIGGKGIYSGNLDNAIIVEGLTSILISINKEYKVKGSSISITGI